MYRRRRLLMTRAADSTTSLQVTRRRKNPARRHALACQQSDRLAGQVPQASDLGGVEDIGLLKNPSADDGRRRVATSWTRDQAIPSGMLEGPVRRCDARDQRPEVS